MGHAGLSLERRKIAHWGIFKRVSLFQKGSRGENGRVRFPLENLSFFLTFLRCAKSNGAESSLSADSDQGFFALDLGSILFRKMSCIQKNLIAAFGDWILENNDRRKDPASMGNHG